jgi:hypothetical protein
MPSSDDSAIGIDHLYGTPNGKRREEPHDDPTSDAQRTLIVPGLERDSELIDTSLAMSFGMPSRISMGMRSSKAFLIVMGAACPVLTIRS